MAPYLFSTCLSSPASSTPSEQRPVNLDEEHPDGPIHAPGATYTAFIEAGLMTVRTSALELITSSAAPFGIISLRVPGQRSNFAHLQLPPADWEWLTYRRPGCEPLLERQLRWDRRRGPLVEARTDSLRLTYRMDSVMRPAVDLAGRYTIRTSDPEFDIAYTVSNGTSNALESPFAMIGFPGFSYHTAIGEVTTVAQTRRPQPPHRSFASEAVAKGLDEYGLLRRAAGPGEDRLSASIAIIEEASAFRLHTAVALPHEFKAHVAHINKPAYMTPPWWIWQLAPLCQSLCAISPVSKARMKSPGSDISQYSEEGSHEASRL